jgi:hypothetical protein
MVDIVDITQKFFKNHVPHSLDSSKIYPNVLRVKAHYGWGGKIVVTLYCFLKVSCLNFNHVIIMKKIYNVFAYYGRSKPEKVKFQINYTF